jgi:hypothetical protein
MAMLLCCSFAFSQPLNDVCANAEDIDCGDDIAGTTSGATFDNVGTCGASNTSAGVWYNIPGTGGSITLSTCNQAAFDTKISVFTGTSCSALTCVGGQDDASGCSGFTTEFSFLSSASNDYWVLVHGFGTATGSFTLSATCAGTPTGNDACTGALPLACGDVVSGSTASATPDFAPFCGTSNTANGVWYEITPPAGSSLTLSTCSANTNYDTKLTVYTGGCGTLTCVDGNDDDFSCPNSIFQSSLTICADGSTYLVLVHGFGSSSGNFELSATCSNPPSNDDACNAEALAVGASVSFDNNCATAQAGEATPPGGTGPGASCNTQNGWCNITFNSEPQADNSVWYSFTPPAGGCVTIDAGGFDTQLAVWSATDCSDFSTYSLVAANDDGGAGLEAQITALSCLDPNATYLIQMDGFGGAAGSGSISITDCGLAPLVCDAGDCQANFVGYAPAEGDTNFLVGSATGGAGGYEYTWSGPGILYTDGGSAAVQPYPDSIGVFTYTLTVTDANGCSTSCTVTVENIDVLCPSSSSGSGSGSGSGSSDFDDVEFVPGSGSSSGSCSADKVEINVCLVKRKSGSASCSGSGSGSGSYDFDELEVLPGSGSSSGSGEEVLCFKNKCIKYDPCKEKDKVAEALAKDPLNHLGPCSIDDCYLNSNPRFDPAPACVDLTIDVLTDNFPGETSVQVISNGVVILDLPQGTYTTSATSFSNTICVDPRECYDVNITDAFGDGICCGFGLGNWSVTFDGVTTNSPTGGAYGTGGTIQVGANCKNSFVDESAVAANARITAFPNPFTDMATFKFVTSTDEQVTLEVFNLNGARIALLFDGMAEAGVSYVKELDGTQLENGLYIYRLVGTNGTHETGRIVLTK